MGSSKGRKRSSSKGRSKGSRKRSSSMGSMGSRKRSSSMGSTGTRAYASLCLRLLEAPTMLNIITRWAVALILLVLWCSVGSALDGLTVKVLP